MPTELDTVFFDLDGTLTDPKPGITGSIQYALQKLGRPVPTQDELAWCIGPPLRQNMRKLLGEDRLHDIDRGVDAYFARYATEHVRETTLYPGTIAMLEAVRASSRKMAPSNGPSPTPSTQMATPMPRQRPSARSRACSRRASS